jgi:uncharacterized protein (TIGR03437 family)
MEQMRKHKFLFVKLAMAAAVVPILIQAYEYGPPPGVTGAPGDNKTGCIQSGCHQGTPNSGSGSVKITLANSATTYTPGGPAIPISVLITDTTMRSYGFEMTARSGTAGTTQAGNLTSTDANTQVICQDGQNVLLEPGKTCPSGLTIQDIEHTETGWSSSISSKGSYTYNFTWTPPATNVGNVTLYIAANCGTGTASVTPTHVYLSNMVLTPGSSTNPNAPSISANGVVPLFSTATTIQPTSWISIYGTNLATSTALWTGNFPTSLGGASVTIDGQPGYLYYASPTQLNLQAPSDTKTGSVNVVVTTGNGTSTSTVTLGQYGPSFSSLDGTHVAGIILRSDGSGAYGGGTYDIVGPTGTSLGYKTVAAKAGDSLVLFGVGFGPTNPTVAAGTAYSGAAMTTSPVSLLINNKSTTPAFAGLTSAGLYQFNLTVPSGLGTGDVPLQGLVGGVMTPTGAVLSLQ